MYVSEVETARKTWSCKQLEYIHSVLQECNNGIIDDVMISTALDFVEIIREQHFKEETL